jgi:hypothetical protein
MQRTGQLCRRRRIGVDRRCRLRRDADVPDIGPRGGDRLLLSWLVVLSLLLVSSEVAGSEICAGLTSSDKGITRCTGDFILSGRSPTGLQP